MSDDEPILRLEGLKKYFTEEDSLIRRIRPDREVKQVRAVDGVDLTVRTGETLGLVGESGCGKSTLARVALRLIEPTGGTVYFRGMDVTRFDREALKGFRSDAQMIFQDPFASLNPRYTVRRTLTEPMKVHDVGGSKAERDRRAAELISRVGLSEEHLDRYPHEFSGGQRQRVSIARALAVEPELIVADEPVSALDVSVQAQILNLLSDLREEMGLSMLFISHDLSVIRRICDRVAVMYLGQIVETGPKKRVFDRPKHPYAQALLSSIPIPDPQVERERIPLVGDVPTPIDPPSGCRFHPRCPKVIPPEDWVGTRQGWRRTLQYRKQIEQGDVQPEAIREQLASRRSGDVSDADLIDAIYEEYITESEVADRQTVSIPGGSAETVRGATARLVDGDREGAVALLAEEFPTVCESQTPRMLDVGEGQVAKCHLHDPEVPGSAEEAREAIQAETAGMER